jgi:hypothetical protein
LSADENWIDQLRSGALGGDAEAAYLLGRAYKLGDLVPADNRQAERWFAKAAQLGHPKGGGEYGLVLLQNGKATEALPWLKEAAARGDPRAQYALATLLFNGRAVPADPTEARRWMSRAARAGLPAAVQALRIMEDPAGLAPPRRGYEIVTIKAPTGAAIHTPRWSVQLGAFANPENARRYWLQVRQGAPLEAAFPVIGGLTRVRVGPFLNAGQAQAYCSAQRKLKRACLEVRSEEAR